MILIKWHYTLFTNWYISHIVFYNSIQILKFAYIISFFELIWTSNWDTTLYFLSTIKYEVTLAMVMLKYVCILSSTKWKEINRMKTVQEIEVKLKTLLNKREWF